MIRKFLGSALIVAALLCVPVLMPVSAEAVDSASEGEACGALNAVNPGACDPNNPNSGAKRSELGGIIGRIVTILAWVAGVISVITIMFGGFRYATSAGDANKIQTAKATIMYALVGLVLAILASVIVSFTVRNTNEAQTPAPQAQSP